MSRRLYMALAVLFVIALMLMTGVRMNGVGGAVPGASRAGEAEEEAPHEMPAPDMEAALAAERVLMIDIRDEELKEAALAIIGHESMAEVCILDVSGESHEVQRDMAAALPRGEYLALQKGDVITEKGYSGSVRGLYNEEFVIPGYGNPQAADRAERIVCTALHMKPLGISDQGISDPVLSGLHIPGAVLEISPAQ